MPENIFYRARRAGAALFTKRCICCKNKFSGRQCLCADCSKKILPADKAFRGNFVTAAAYAYCGPARDVMLHFKFNKSYTLCIDTLSDWLCYGFDRYYPGEQFDFAVSVPAFGGHPRLELIASDFARRRGLCYRPALLSKIRRTQKQHTLSAAERSLNLRGAFAANPAVAGKKILLVDDIFTTGSTVKECASVLISAGAAKVSVLTVLKTISEPEDLNF